MPDKFHINDHTLFYISLGDFYMTIKRNEYSDLYVTLFMRAEEGYRYTIAQYIINTQKSFIMYPFLKQLKAYDNLCAFLIAFRLELKSLKEQCGCIISDKQIEEICNAFIKSIEWANIGKQK